MRQLVKFSNGKYAIRKKTWTGKWVYRSKYSERWWSTTQEVTDYCMLDTEEAAMVLAYPLNIVEIKDIP